MRIEGKEIPTIDMAFSAEERKYLEDAKKRPITYDEDSPETTPDRAMRFRRVKPSKVVVND